MVTLAEMTCSSARCAPGRGAGDSSAASRRADHGLAVLPFGSAPAIAHRRQLRVGLGLVIDFASQDRLEFIAVLRQRATADAIVHGSGAREASRSRGKAQTPAPALFVPAQILNHRTTSLPLRAHSGTHWSLSEVHVVPAGRHNALEWL